MDMLGQGNNVGMVNRAELCGKQQGITKGWRALDPLSQDKKKGDKNASGLFRSASSSSANHSSRGMKTRRTCSS